MTTAIIGVGHLGSALAQHLVRGSEPVVLAAEDQSHARQVATELGPLATAATVREAIAQSDTVVLAVWLDKLKQVVAEHSDLLNGKVVVDPTNPVGFDENGNFVRTLPEHQSSGSVVAGLLPPRAHYVKAFGTLGAVSLGASANRTPRRVALFYATDDDQAAATVERLISAAGFDPVKAGGLKAAARIETPGGDLQESGLGRLLDADEARAAVVAATAA
jgi:8-hydroxy-5-deazaflavin:NADPH oxidoreductase